MTGHLFDTYAADVAITNDDWYTPRWIPNAAGLEFDLDVAAPVAEHARTIPARRFLTVLDDGLTAPWDGLVWCNPPYSGTTPWVEKWAAHEGDGMILVPAVKALWIGTLLASVDAMTLLRIKFHRPNGLLEEPRWLSLLAGKGAACVDAVAAVAASDGHVNGNYLVRPGRGVR